MPISATSARFRRRQGFARGRTHAFVDEALEAAAIEVLADIQVALTIDCKRVRHVQRSAEDSLLSDVIDHL